MTDEDGHAAAIVTGTAIHEGETFKRQLVHLFTLRDGQVVEFRDLPFDQYVEDQSTRMALGERVVRSLNHTGAICVTNKSPRTEPAARPACDGASDTNYPRSDTEIFGSHLSPLPHRRVVPRPVTPSLVIQRAGVPGRRRRRP
jgi:hypothetical protein